MPLEDLDLLLEDLGIDPTKDEVQEMLKIFNNNFVTNPFQIKGCNIKVILNPSYQSEFRGLPETFVHLITRENKFKGKREFDYERANRIHWIKPILLNHNSAQIKYFEFPDKKGVVKHHYWYEQQNFMVVLKPILPDMLVVTAFCIDDYEALKYKKRYATFRKRL